jgi:biopolymer transport protein ExbD
MHMRSEPGSTGARPALATDINVTPMIDVLLVLLIIFMAAIPSMRKSIDVQLPEPRPARAESPSPSIVLELDEAGGARINQEPVAPGTLDATLHRIYDGRPDKVLFVKGAPRLRYAAVVDAMDVARGAGVKVIGWP